MSLKINIEKKADYLVANFSGQANLQEVGNRFESLAVHCRSAKRNKLLMNISAIKAVPSFSERFRAGERAVIFSEFGIKVAVVASPDQVEPRRLAELVAQNRGVDVRIFLDLAAAEEWLLGEPPS
jgi:Holliday junction resolvase